MAVLQQWHGVGKRKTAIARVYLRLGQGGILVNDQRVEEYFTRPTSLMVMQEPLKLTQHEGTFDILVNVKGGGKSGQAGAIRLGISRALEKFDPKLRLTLKRAGFLTRDSRIVERKKYGRPGARKRFQFSKR
ncbi:MAG: 30S ribosomal protein S9 [Bradymonadales bacterium]|nr:30S ribosomal protein S9 [Bradymonadales bacterium]